MTLPSVANKPPRLVLRFAIYSALAIFVAGVGLLWFIRQEEQERAERDIAARASRVAVRVADDLEGSDFRRRATGERLAALDKLFDQELRDGLVRVKMWSRSGAIVYSNDHSLMGTQQREPDQFAEVLAGMAVREVTRLNEEHPADVDLKVLETFVPIRPEEGRGRSVGALELSYDYQPVAEEVAATVTAVAAGLGVALLLLFVTLIPILRRVTAALEQRNRALEQTLAERERAEKSLRRTQASYRNLVEQLPLVTYMDELNESSSAIYMSPQIESILGYTPHEWVEDPELFPKLLHPEDRERVLREHKEAYQAGTPLSTDYRLVARDGRVVWFHDEVTVAHDEDGRPQHAQGFLLDVTEQKAAEEAVRASAERFRTLVSNIPGAVFRSKFDSEWTMEFISSAVEEISGYPASDFVGNRVRSFASIVHPDDSEGEQVVQSALRDTRPYSIEYRVVRPDGEIRWVLEKAQGVGSTADGEPLIEGAIFDVTELKEAEVRLLEAELRNRTLVEQLPLVTFIRGLENETTNAYVSPQVVALLGYSIEEWEQDRTIFPRIVHPEDRERASAASKRLRETGEPMSMDYRCVAKDGRVVWVRDETQLVRDEHGEPLWVQGYLLDITERRADEEARSSLAAIVETSDDAIMAAGLDGIMTSWNTGAERIFGYSAEEAIGQPISILAPPDRRQEPLKLLARSKRGKAVEHHETVRLTKDGRLIDVSLTVSPIIDSAGEIVGASAIARDVSERKKADAERDRLLSDLAAQNERLLELDKLKDEFIALVSHELRTPLTSIRGYVDLLLDGEAGELSDDQRQFLQVVERNSGRLLTLVGDLLFLAQVEAGRLVLDVGAVDLSSVAADAVETARPTADAKGVTLTLASGPLPLVTGDRSRLGQLLDNLVSNAVKFTPDGGRVDVRARTHRGNVVIEVRDTGVGIPANEQAHVFERFYRSSKAAERQIPGTGLGLAISKAIVEAHGGRIKLSSDEGEGTSFQVTLPVRQPQESELEPETAATG